LNRKEASALSLVAILLFAYIGVPHVLAQPKAQGIEGSLKVKKIAENVFSIETIELNLTTIVEEISESHTRLRCINQTREIMVFDIVKKGNQIILLVNGVEAYRLLKDRIPALKPDLSDDSVTTESANIYYWWDGVRFVEGPEIKYPHPDRDCYGISPYSSWIMLGDKLIHYQIDQRASQALVDAPPEALGAAIGAIIGAKIGGLPGAVIGGVVGALLGAILAPYTTRELADEKECIWWWVSQAFVKWLIDNAFSIYLTYRRFSMIDEYLGILAALFRILDGFLRYGYLRVGPITFYDAVGAGRPRPEPEPEPV
jgi:hypothetical protein